MKKTHYKPKFKYRKGDSFLTTILNLFTFIRQFLFTIYILIQISVSAIQTIIKFFTPIFKYLGSTINNLRNAQQKKKLVLDKPISIKSKSKTKKQTIPSNLIQFSKYQKSNIS